MRIAYLYLIVINLLDFLTTSLLVQRHGYEVEANALLRTWMVASDSVYPIIVTKVAALVAFGIAMLLLKYKEPDRYKLNVWVWTTWIVNTLLTFIVFGSTYMLLIL